MSLEQAQALVYLTEMVAPPRNPAVSLTDTDCYIVQQCLERNDGSEFKLSESQLALYRIVEQLGFMLGCDPTELSCQKVYETLHDIAFLNGMGAELLGEAIKSLVDPDAYLTFRSKFVND